MIFYEKLARETQAHRNVLYSVPQLVDALNGKINRETYIGYLTQAYHHVKHTVPFLMAMGARLPENKSWLLPSIAEYIEEEIGHEEWILNDIAAAGGDVAAARRSKPHRETELLIAYNYDYIARRNPVGFLGMVYMLESTSTEIATAGADSLKTALGLPKSAFTYLYSHGSLDVEHLEFFKKTVNKVDDPADQQAILDVAQITFLLFADVMKSIPHPGTENKHHAA
jgi:long-chain acyl-CoA synthetase